ncbi:MAG: hypothetical protein K9J13_15660 [Saprospiraceae bacterium]|nr:hypothetical protein [Saprospiraceae bacterium]
MKNRIIAILFLFLLIAPALIVFSWLNHKKSVVKHQVKLMIIDGIDKEELTLLKFTKQESETELEWEHSMEFEYKQQMYDIVETEVVNDTIYYWCWLDNRETKLNKQLAKLLINALNADPQRKEKQEYLVSYFKSLYCSNHFIWNHSIFETEVKPSFNFLNFYKSLSSPPSKPPPRLVLS